LTNQDPTTPSDGTELVASMGWEPLPYGCVGMARSREMSGSRTVWSWLVLIPWAINDAKPWIDGTELMEGPLMSVEEQRAKVFTKMREILDKRYGETVGKQAAEEFIRKFQEED
jgi:hypothetical protein